MTTISAFGLNRFDYTSPSAFAADAKRAEALGWDYAFIPSSPLLLQDPYVNLAFAAGQWQPGITSIPRCSLIPLTFVGTVRPWRN